MPRRPTPLPLCQVAGCRTRVPYRGRKNCERHLAVGKGFGEMDPERLRAVSAKGARSSGAQGRSHRWTAEEALAAAQQSADRRRRKAWS